MSDDESINRRLNDRYKKSQRDMRELRVKDAKVSNKINIIIRRKQNGLAKYHAMPYNATRHGQAISFLSNYTDKAQNSYGCGTHYPYELEVKSYELENDLSIFFYALRKKKIHSNEGYIKIFLD